MTRPTHPLVVWLIDDDENDHLFLRRSAKRVPQEVALRCFPSALEAIKVLSLPHCPSPDLILCDMRMPKLSGDAFVRWLRSTRHRSVPVVIRSTSDLESDILTAYESGANAYVQKGMELNRIEYNFNHLMAFGLMVKRGQAIQAQDSSSVD